jgi:hypothetical protein
MVIEVEPTQVGWIRIDDTDGNVYRYVKGGKAKASLPAHVECEVVPPMKVVLVRDQNGEAVLRQKEPGLPARIGVSHAELLPGAPVGVTSTLFVTRLEYELES